MGKVRVSSRVKLWPYFKQREWDTTRVRINVRVRVRIRIRIRVRVGLGLKKG